MKSKLKQYATLFLSTFQLSAFTFGGGFVIIPLIRKKFVEQLGWIGEEEMLDLAAIAQSSPGAIAVNISILVGYRVAGIPGALLTVVGTVTPPLIIISVISLFYAAFRDNVFVNMAMCGMLAGVAAVILDVVLRLAGMGLRIWLANALGGAGMGLYQLVLAVYGLFVTLATAGISVAAARLLTEELSRDKAAARGMLVRLVLAGLTLGGLAMVAQLAPAGLAAKWWLGDVRAAADVKAL